MPSSLGLRISESAREGYTCTVVLVGWTEHVRASNECSCHKEPMAVDLPQRLRTLAPARSFRYPVVQSPQALEYANLPIPITIPSLPLDPPPNVSNYPPLPSSVDRHLEETAARSICCTHFPYPCLAQPRGEWDRISAPGVGWGGGPNHEK